jgi:putrescine transport system substrate-binding protein
MSLTSSTRWLLSAIALSLCALAALPARAQSDEKVLNFYNWSAYIADDTLANFEKETGIKVRYDTFDSSEMLHAKLVAGKTGYDIVMSSSGWARMQADAGLIQPLNKALLPNLKNLDPVITGRMAELDPGNQHMLNWLWGYTTVGINVDKVKAALGSTPMPDNAWDLLFKPEYAAKLKSCGISYLDSASEVLPAVLHYLGLPLNTNKPEHYAAAAAVLKSVRPYVTLFSSAGYTEDLVNGALCVSMGWSGDINGARMKAQTAKTGQHIEALVPKTGGVLFFDTMVIPADAPHVENAHKFMNYILRGEVHAAQTNKLMYANPNLEARKFVKPEILSSRSVFPDKADIGRMGVQGAVNNDIRRQMVKVYTAFKTGR